MEADTYAPDTAPRISVILVFDGQRERGARCLASVLGQSVGAALEALLIDVGPSTTRRIAGSDDPRVRVLRPPPGTPFGRALADAVWQASRSRCRHRPQREQK
jgi:hypothetical protein